MIVTAALSLWLAAAPQPGADARAVPAGGAADPVASACARDTTQLDLTRCAEAKYQAADRLLNAQWRATSDALKARDARGARPGPGQARPRLFDTLLTAQRAWIAYRDAQCAAEQNEYAGGSIAPMIRLACLERLTRARTAELRALTEAH